MSVAPEVSARISPVLTRSRSLDSSRSAPGRRSARGTILFDEGDHDIDFFVVLSGAVEICHVATPRAGCGMS